MTMMLLYGGGIITADSCVAMQNFRSKCDSGQERVSQLNLTCESWEYILCDVSLLCLYLSHQL